MNPTFYIVYTSEYGQAVKEYKLITNEQDLAPYLKGWSVLKVIETKHQDLKLTVQDHV